MKDYLDVYAKLHPTVERTPDLVLVKIEFSLLMNAMKRTDVRADIKRLTYHSHIDVKSIHQMVAAQSQHGIGIVMEVLKNP